MTTRTTISAAALAAALLCGVVWGSGTEYRPPPSVRVQPKRDRAADSFKQGKQAAEAGNFAEAARLFGEALKLDPRSPDILNELAHAQRKLGKLDDAFTNYNKALKLRPKFPEAREYLGEAHVQAVLREIETLKGYGDAGKEELEDLVKALKDAAAAQP